MVHGLETISKMNKRAADAATLAMSISKRQVAELQKAIRISGMKEAKCHKCRSLMLIHKNNPGSLGVCSECLDD